MPLASIHNSFRVKHVLDRLDLPVKKLQYRHASSIFHVNYNSSIPAKSFKRIHDKHNPNEHSIKNVKHKG